MKLSISLFSACCMLLFACKNRQPASTSAHQVDSTAENRFQQLSIYFIDELWKTEPEWATGVGMHRYDSILTIPDEASRNRSLQFAARFGDSLRSVDIDKLSPANQIDYELIKNYLEKQKWAIEEYKAYEWDPSSYNPSNTIAFMLTEQYAPLPERLKSIGKRLQSIPAYYAAAKTNIKNPVPELVQLAIDQNKGGLSIFSKDLVDSLKRSGITNEEQKAFLVANDSAIAAIQSYVRYLESILPASNRSFRIGKALYDKKFRYDIQSSYTAEELYQSALDRKQYLHREMLKTSRELWPKYFGDRPPPADSLELIARMIDTLSYMHVRPEAFQTAIEKQIPELIQFIEEKDLLYIDPAKPLVVRKEPAYMAGVAGASISAPGPYDTAGNTYYNVGSLEGWEPERAESYLREYNHYILQILNIHEAIPGHYTQLVYANKSPSLIKSILGNGAMIEGWAVYTEQMMLESGYGNNEPEMWLMWYKWNLRTVCNTILDYSVHVKNMSKEDALSLLTKEAFQEQAEAEGKWKRVSVTSVQLTSYYAGYKDIIKLREQIQKLQGSNFNLKKFHEQFLSYGNAPVKSISRLMTASL